MVRFDNEFRCPDPLCKGRVPDVLVGMING